MDDVLKAECEKLRQTLGEQIGLAAITDIEAQQQNRYTPFGREGEIKLLPHIAFAVTIQHPTLDCSSVFYEIECTVGEEPDVPWDELKQTKKYDYILEAARTLFLRTQKYLAATNPPHLRLIEWAERERSYEEEFSQHKLRITEESTRLRRQAIEETDLLTWFDWEMEISISRHGMTSDSGFRLIARMPSEPAGLRPRDFDEHVDHLHEVMGFWHHAHAMFGNMRLQVDDGEVRLIFVNRIDLDFWHQKLGLRVRFNQLDKNISELEERHAEMERVIAEAKALRQDYARYSTGGSDGATAKR